MRSTLIYASSFALGLALAQPALAQTGTEPPSDSDMVDATVNGRSLSDSSPAPDIIVTGSRLPSEFSVTSPVQVLDVDSAAVRGHATAAEIVARATAATGTQQINNQFSAIGPGGAAVPGGANINSISLRNLGATRTLTLLNGQRIVPSGTGSQVAPVDYNVIPSVALDRVEVLTTGASSIYGSDAIAGVINIITRQGGDGLELGGFVRLPERTGGRYVQANAYWGRDYDHFHVSAALEYDRQDELDLKDRPETACRQDFVYNPATGARDDARDASGDFRCFNHSGTGIFFDQFWFGGSFVHDPTKANGPYPPAALGLQIPGNPLTAPLLDWVRANRGGFPDTFPYSPNTSRAYDEADAISPFRRINAYVSAGVDVGDSAELYFNALYSNRKSVSNSWYFLNPFVSAANPNNSVALALIVASGGNSSGDIGVQIVRPFRAEQEVKFFQSTVGLRGAFDGMMNGWNYDVSARVGLSRGTYGQTFYYLDRLRAATGPGVACNPGLITVSAPTNCVSIPWLSKRFLVDQEWTDAERNFLEGYEEGHTSYSQFAVEGSLSGSLASLPAGDVAAAIGFAIRTDDLDDSPGYHAQNQNYFAFSTAGRTAGSDTVREIFGEIGVPLLADQPFFQSLRFTASARYTDYQSYGSNTTYRVAGAWKIAREVALRASYGTSFRAPTIYELNLADQTSFFNYFDPCRRYGDGANPTVAQNCQTEGFAPDFNPFAPGILGVSGGGKGLLKAETSTNFNAGIVIRPGFANLQLAIDYYDIKVKNEVDTFGVINIVNSCYSLTGGQRTSFCDLITRDPTTRAITTVSNRYLNLAEQRARGVDFALQFSVPLASETDFGFELRGARALENTITRDTLSPTQERNGLSGFPKLTGNAEARVSWKNLTWFAGAHYIGKVDDTRFYEEQGAFVPGTTNFRFFGAYAGRQQYGNPNDFAELRGLLAVPAHVTIFTSLRWKPREKTTLILGVNNLFDKKPAVTGSNSYTFRIGSAAGNQYDLTGRTFYLRIGQGF